MTISLKTDSKVPLYEQIYAYIRGDIRSGRIPCGEKLPSTRALSRHLEVSRSTVELAYEQLLSEGYLESEPCRGYFAARIDDLYRLDRPGRLERREQESEKARHPAKKRRTIFLILRRTAWMWTVSLTMCGESCQKTS